MLEMETTEGMIGSSSAQEEKPRRKLEFFLILIALFFFFPSVVPSIGKHPACKHANYNFVRFNDGSIMQVISIPRPVLTVLLKTICVPCKRTIKIVYGRIKITDIKFTVLFLSVTCENAVTLK